MLRLWMYAYYVIIWRSLAVCSSLIMTSMSWVAGRAVWRTSLESAKPSLIFTKHMTALVHDIAAWHVRFLQTARAFVGLQYKLMYTQLLSPNVLYQAACIVSMGCAWNRIVKHRVLLCLIVVRYFMLHVFAVFLLGRGRRIVHLLLTEWDFCPMRITKGGSTPPTYKRLDSTSP